MYSFYIFQCACSSPVIFSFNAPNVCVCLEDLLYVWTEPKLCMGGVTLPEKKTLPCESVEFWVQLGAGLGAFAAVLLVSLTFYFWKKNKRYISLFPFCMLLLLFVPTPNPHFIPLSRVPPLYASFPPVASSLISCPLPHFSVFPNFTLMNSYLLRLPLLLMLLLFLFLLLLQTNDFLSLGTPGMDPRRTGLVLQVAPLDFVARLFFFVVAF